jgi:predicted dehydrogenase
MTEPTRRTFIAQTAGALAGYAILPEFAAGSPPSRAGGRVAVIGIGRQGRAIIAELQKIEGVQIVAVCDVVEGRATIGTERAPGARPFTDHRTLLLGAAADLDAVIVATPTHRHREIVEDVLAAGKHLYCEAPIAATPEDCDAMVAAAAAHPTLVSQAGLVFRSNPIYRRVRTLMRAGTLRDLVSLYAQSHRKTSWRFPAPDPALERAFNWRLDPEVSIGLAGEQGTHAFDVMCWYRERYPRRITGGGGIRLHDDGRTIADTVHADLVFDDGINFSYRATLANSFGGEHELLHGTNSAVRLSGTHGWLFREVDAPTEGWEVYAMRQQFHNDEGIALIADATKLAEQGRLQEGIGLPNPPLYYALADFVRSFSEETPVACTLEEGARATLLGILADRAVRTGAAIDVPEMG